MRVYWCVSCVIVRFVRFVRLRSFALFCRATMLAQQTAPAHDKASRENLQRTRTPELSVISTQAETHITGM